MNINFLLINFSKTQNESFELNETHDNMRGPPLSSSSVQGGGMCVIATDAFKAAISHGSEKYPTRTAATVGDDRK